MKVAGPELLILDAQVAASVRQIAHRVYTRAGIDQDMASWLWPTSNWWAHRYGQYVELAHRVASLLPDDLPSRPDALERPVRRETPQIGHLGSGLRVDHSPAG
jgi:hypothetical protein